jgi:hypothetical protein
VKAIMLNCTLKASPARSNTGALAEVVHEWPGIRSRVLGSEILLFATPTWLGRPASTTGRAAAANLIAVARALEASPIPPPPSG